ncbi:msr9110 (plasmid) [Mesorhizobium japonicum MAFF 303099]|uniref:Msr9110 protein n=1 Tax=Mesorhizobium japonicum (strain LMG 29417 / CECT 9101 / MAFF 303099) TaxID=266835 RepID=Q982E8_RHILO|nr:msr9110 [Mesorhizobium japonicum MAFF 303099]
MSTDPTLINQLVVTATDYAFRQKVSTPLIWLSHSPAHPQARKSLIVPTFVFLQANLPILTIT